MEMWLIWVLAAGLLAILEIFIPGLTLICICGGALAAALAAALGLGMVAQLVFFIFASLLGFLFIRPIMLTLVYPDRKGGDTNVHAFIGKSGTVVREIVDGERGWVRVEHEEWPALGITGENIPAGAKIIVKDVQGNTFLVEGVL